jgi:hypothetical protein
MLPHDELLHYGRRGMKWGIRNSRAATEVRNLKEKRLEKKVNRLDTKASKLATGKIHPDSAFTAEKYRRKADKLRSMSIPSNRKQASVQTFNKKLKTSSWSDKDFKKAVFKRRAQRTAATVLSVAILGGAAATAGVGLASLAGMAPLMMSDAQEAEGRFDAPTR